jgi:acyl carrier protein
MSARQLLAAALDCAPQALAPDSAIGTLPLWDSLAHIKVVLAVEERLGRSLSTDEILAITSLAAIDELLDAKKEGAAPEGRLPPQPD